MSWTFDTALSTNKDYVRFLIGDTNTSNQLIQDETIEAVLANEPNVWITGAEILESMARGLMGGGVIEDRKVGETRVRYRSAKDLRLDASGLRARGRAHMKPEAGGIYTADTKTYDQNTAINHTANAKDIMENPRRGSTILNVST